MSTRILLVAGVALAVLGIVIAFLGIVMPGLFVAGTRVVLVGLLVCAAAGIHALVRPAGGSRP
jgi:hypothetical protein